MIRSLSEYEFEKEAKNALMDICGTDHPNPYITPFISRVQWRKILCPYDHVPEDNLLFLIRTIAREKGESGFFLTVYDRPPEVERRFPYHWYIPFDKINTYKKTIGICKDLPTVVFSPNATWGIIADIEGMGVIGATKEWGYLLESKFPDLRNNVQEFIKLFKWFRDLADHEGNVDFSWVPRLLEHVYGDTIAKEFLEDAMW